MSHFVAQQPVSVTVVHCMMGDKSVVLYVGGGKSVVLYTEGDKSVVLYPV